MSTGGELEGTVLGFLDDITAIGDPAISRQQKVLGVAAQRLLGELREVYSKYERKGSGAYEAQQLYARLRNLKDLVPPKEAKALTETFKGDLAKAYEKGSDTAKGMAEILKATPETLKKTAKPNIAAMNAAGIRLENFWRKENSDFRDRVTALTQTALAQGQGYRKLSLQIRELLVLERDSGRESQRSERLRKRMGIAGRAELIARTELQTAGVQGKLASIRKMGYEWARWSATGERSCPFCISRDGLLYTVDDIEGAIPAHPRCRCSLIPADPPDNFKNKRFEDKGLDAAESLDDAYWAKSRAKKIREFQANNPKIGDSELRRYAKTPTNAQKFLKPGTPAPEPQWAPSGQLIPNLERVILNSQRLAERTRQQDKKAEDLKSKEAEQLIKDAEAELAKQRAEDEAKELARTIVEERKKEEFTFKRHSNAEGNEPDGKTIWTPERQKLHDQIVKEFLKNGKRVDKPTFTMSGGGPASGKGFMLKKTGLDKPGRVLIDADEIKKMIPEYANAQKKGGKAQQKAAGVVHEESSYLAKRIMAEAASKSFDVVLDGTGDNGIKSLAKKIQKMRDKGYRVEAKYVSADTDLAAQRNWDRFLKTGRLPPEFMLRNVHADVSRTLPQAIKDGLFDAVELYDTNLSGQLRKVVSQKNGGRVTIHDKQLWDDFKKKGEAEQVTEAQGERMIEARKLKVKESAKTTHEKHSNARGVGAEPDADTIWTMERQKLHQEIITKFLENGIKSDKPTFTMSGGGPASGKGFMLKKTGLDKPGKVVIDADEIKKMIPEYADAQKKGGKAQQKAAGMVHEESSYLAKRIMGEAANRSFDVVLDGTGDNGIKSLTKKIQKMRDKGYKVDAKYVSADTDLAAQRNWDRFLKTGRLPPEFMLRNVHADVSRTLPQALKDGLFDEVELFDTNKSGELRKVVSQKGGGRVTIHDKQLWDDFQRKGEAEQVSEAQGERMIEARKLKVKKTAKTSHAKHSNARAEGAEPDSNTVWTLDRQKLHKEIVEKFLSTGVKSDTPTFTMSGGGPASGKGFMLKKTGLDKPGKVVIDADEIKKLLPEYADAQKKGGKAQQEAAGYVHEESSYLAKRIMAEASKKRFDVVLDGTGDNGIKSLAKKVKKMKDEGYRVEAKYVSADTDLAAQRNWDRFIKTGRLPPEFMLRNVHADVSRTLPQALKDGLFDAVELYDTNKSGELRKVVSQKNRGKTVIHDKQLWDDFKRKGEAPQVTAEQGEQMIAKRKAEHEAKSKGIEKKVTAKPTPKAEKSKLTIEQLDLKIIEAKAKSKAANSESRKYNNEYNEAKRNMDYAKGYIERNAELAAGNEVITASIKQSKETIKNAEAVIKKYDKAKAMDLERASMKAADDVLLATLKRNGNTVMDPDDVAKLIRKTADKDRNGEEIIKYTLPLNDVYKKQNYNTKPELLKTPQEFFERNDLLMYGDGINRPFFRGVGAAKTGDDYLAQFQGKGDNGGKHFAGEGIFGNGTYAASSNTSSWRDIRYAFDEAETYTKGVGGGGTDYDMPMSPDRVGMFGVKKDAKVLKLSDFQQGDFTHHQFVKSAQRILKTKATDPGELAAAMGYDVVMTQDQAGNYDQEFWIILNRGKVVSVDGSIAKNIPRDHRNDETGMPGVELTKKMSEQKLGKEIKVINTKDKDAVVSQWREGDYGSYESSVLANAMGLAPNAGRNEIMSWKARNLEKFKNLKDDMEENYVKAKASDPSNLEHEIFEALLTYMGNV